MAETVRPPSLAFEGSCSVGGASPVLPPFVRVLWGRCLPFLVADYKSVAIPPAAASPDDAPRCTGLRFLFVSPASWGRCAPNGRPRTCTRTAVQPIAVLAGWPSPPRSIHAGTALLSFCPDPLGAMASLSCGKRSRPPLHRMAFPLAFPYVLFGECFCRSSVFSFVPMSCLSCGKPHSTSVSIVSELRVRAGRVILTICSCGRDKLPGG